MLTLLDGRERETVSQAPASRFGLAMAGLYTQLRDRANA
jgi:hypothetical protein